MRRAIRLTLLPTLLLAACADPRGACVDRAFAEVRAIEAEVSGIELALGRGYRVAPGSAVNAGITLCARDSPITLCVGGDRTLSERRVALDRPAEEARLRALRTRLPAAEAEARRAAAACPAP